MHVARNRVLNGESELDQVSILVFPMVSLSHLVNVDAIFSLSLFMPPSCHNNNNCSQAKTFALGHSAEK